jgi:hypothetical protein
LPDKAGVDPFAAVIDRVPDDNTKTVALVNGNSALRSSKQRRESGRGR